MRKITIEGHDYQVPGEWNEMTAEQLCFLATLLDSPRTTREVGLRLLLFCLKARVRRYRAADGEGHSIVLPHGTIWVRPEQLAALSGIYDFLFKETEEGFGLDIRLTRNPFPVYHDGKVTLHGPDDGLTNISYGQFIMLQTWQQRMRSDPKGAVDQFLAVLWKKGPFTLQEDGAPAWFRRVDPAAKTVMLWFYLGCVEFIQEKFPRVFSTRDDGDPVDIFDAQQRVVDEMASGDVTKKEPVKRSLLFDALYTLEMAIENDERRKRQQ